MGSNTSKLSISVSSCEASPLPGENGTSKLVIFSRPTFPAKTIVSANEISFFEEIGSRISKTLANCSGLLASQFFCGSNLILAPLAPPLISEIRNVEAEAHAVSIMSCAERFVCLISFFIKSTS